MQYEDSRCAGRGFHGTTREVKIKSRNYLGIHWKRWRELGIKPPCIVLPFGKKNKCLLTKAFISKLSGVAALYRKAGA